MVEDTPVGISLVDESTIESDSKKYNATVFNGWVKSNQVKLIVE